MPVYIAWANPSHLFFFELRCTSSHICGRWLSPFGTLPGWGLEESCVGWSGVCISHMVERLMQLDERRGKLTPSGPRARATRGSNPNKRRTLDLLRVYRPRRTQLSARAISKRLPGEPTTKETAARVCRPPSAAPPCAQPPCANPGGGGTGALWIPE